VVYPVWLAGLAALFICLERLWPLRPDQPLLRRGIWSDIGYIIFNSEFLGVLIGNLSILIIARIDRTLDLAHLKSALYMGAMAKAPGWLQFIVLLLVFDFLQWAIHNLLHRVGWLWEFHKVHHSIVDMDWIGDWRFHWVEVVVYRSLLYIPAAFFGFQGAVMFWVGIVNTAIGHFAHANLKVHVGTLKYVINTPEMHIWHHNHPESGPINRNFGITLSLWDWLFGTAYVPPRDPARLGFEGIETYPVQLPGQWLAPFVGLFKRGYSSVERRPGSMPLIGATRGTDREVVDKLPAQRDRQP
jgi:sterol desaturase/sphingolipid hydroxylase (fatty acid hydroxylase superfamily)